MISNVKKIGLALILFAVSGFGAVAHPVDAAPGHEHFHCHHSKSCHSHSHDATHH